MNLLNYDRAVSAFLRVVSLDTEFGEAWNNLGSIYIKQKKK